MVRLLWDGFRLRLALLIGAGLLIGGCGMELETGYKYRPLSATPVQRRAYYASPFSPEKTAAEQEQRQGGPKAAPAPAQ